MDVAWDDLRTVMVLVRHGSLAAAAAELGVNYTTVARRVRRAEAALDQRLFERLADGYRPTEAAHLIAAHAGRMETAEQGLLRQLQGRDTALSGPLTITAPQLLLATFLSPVLDTFETRYPEVELHIRASNELLDLSRREADLAIRISNDPGDTLTGLRLLRQQNASFAHPDLAARLTEDPSQMVNWIVYAAHTALPRNISPIYPNHRIRFRFDDMAAMAGAAQAGLGVVRMPLFLGRSLPDLVQVPILPPRPYMDIWVVGHPDVWPSAKLRAFRDILVGYCKANRALFVA